MNDIAFKVIIKNDGIDDVIFKTIMLKGEKGDKGDAGETEIDDSTTSATKTWSSQKINSMIAQTETIEDVAIASFSDGADDVPVSELIVDITAVQAGSGAPSPDNIRDFLGFDNAVITRCGKNLFNEIYPSISTLKYMSIFVGKGTFTMSTDLPTRTDTFANLFFLANKVSSGADSALNGVYNNRPVTVTSTDGYVTIAYRYDEYNPENYHSQIELGNQATDYESYKGNNYTFAFGQTVYGGHFDNKGNFVITEGLVDLGSLTWVKDSSITGNYYYTTFSNKKNGISNFICSIFQNTEKYGVEAPDLSIRGARDDKRIFIRYNAQSTVSDFTTAVNGAKLKYELETPITISITSQDVATLLGNNNIFANTGNINKLVYFKTGSEAVARMIEAYMRASN